MPLSAARREQESARLGRELYIAEQKPSILKLGKAAIDEGGGMAHIQDQMWEQLPADGKQGYIAAARRKQHGEAAFKLFEAELQPSISEASEDHSLMGSGGERVKRAMWEELSPAQQDGYVDIAAKKAREQSIAAARASPGKKKRKPRASGSPKSASVAKQYTRAIYEAITSLKDRNGSTVQGIAGWLKSKPSKLDNEVQIKKALKSGVRAKKFEKQKGGVRYKVTKEFRKEILDEQKKEREKEREAEKKIKDEQRKQQLAQQKADRAKLLEQQQQLKDARKKIDAAERERKTALKLNKYPVDDLQALAEVALCDSENMMFYPVAEKHREEVKNLDERRNELFRDAHEANKEKYAEGTRVKMFLQDDEGEEWYYGNVVAVSDKGLDIFFDDDDFQMDVQFDDTDLHLVVAEETEHEEKNTLVDFPTTITDGGAVSARMRAECMAVSSMLMRFSKDVTLPDLSGEEVVDIVSQVSEPGDGASDEEHRAFKVLKEQRNAVHVQLLHVIGTEHMFAEDFIYTEVSEEMIDAYSWPEVLQRFILSNLEDDLQCNAEIRKAASDLAARSYDNITLEQRVCLLSYLCSEALQSPDIRDVIEEDMEATDKLVKEFDESEKALKDKQREQLRKERAEEREKLAEKKKETEGARLAAKQEREAKTAADRAEFKQWLVDRKKPPLEDPKDAKWKTEWKNWKTWKTQEKKRAENEAKAKARKEEQERVRAEKKAAKEAEKIAKAEARAEAKAAKEKAKAEAKEAKKLAKQSKGKNKIMGLDVGEVTAPEQSLAALHGMSRGEYMKHLREQREQALAAEREKRELEELEKQEKIRLEKEAEKEKDARRARGMKKFKQLQAQGRAKQSKEEYQREKEERRVRKKQEKLTSDLEAHACSLTPLGRDRFLNRYWWTPAYPGRLYVEKMKVPLEFLPPLTRAVHACAGSEEERRKAATEAVTQQINSLPEETVRKQLQALQLSIEDEADVRELAIELMQKDLKGREPCLVEFANTGKVVLPPKRVTRPPSRPKKPKPADGSAASGDAAAALPTDAAAAAVDSEQASPREEGSEEKQAEEQAAAATDAEQASPRESEGGQSAADVEMAVEDDEEEEDEDWDGEVDTNYWGLNRTEEDWGYYDTPEQLDALMSNINVLGRREKELNANIVRYEERISEGMMTNRARGRGRRGGGGQKKKAVDTITMLKGELPNLVRKFIPKTEKLRTDGKWEKSVDQCGLWMDIVEPLSELGTALGELGIAADAKASEKAALVGRQWTEQEDKELTELVLEEGPGDWEDKKERMESKRSAAAIKMRWENTLEAKAAEDAKKKKEAGEAFALHQVVWAKIKHFPWWPAYISNNPKTGEALNPKNKKFHVTFFPDNSTGQCLAEDLQPFEAALDEHTSTKIGNKKRAKEREEAVKQAKKYMKDHSDAQKADAPAVKAASPKARPAPKEDGKDDGAAQDKDKEKEKEEDSDDESDSEEEEEEYPATWQQWIPKWQQVVASCNNEVRLTFAFYALRERTEQTIPPLKAPPASASKKRGGKGRAAARKSPGRKGRRRSDHVNYNEDSDDDSEEEEEENKKLGPDDMHDAVADNDRTTLRKVLSSGVDVNALDEDDRTALMNAAESGSKACLRLCAPQTLVVGSAHLTCACRDRLLTNDSTDIDATDPDGWYGQSGVSPSAWQSAHCRLFAQDRVDVRGEGGR